MEFFFQVVVHDNSSFYFDKIKGDHRGDCLKITNDRGALSWATTESHPYAVSGKIKNKSGIPDM